MKGHISLIFCCPVNNMFHHNPWVQYLYKSENQESRISHNKENNIIGNFRKIHTGFMDVTVSIWRHK